MEKTTAIFATSLLIQSISFTTWAAPPSVEVKDVPIQSDDTTVTIKKGTPGESSEFEVISGSDPIVGDPKPGLKESYASWKGTCETWKKEMKDLNQDNHLITLNCNAPSSIRHPDGQQIYQSTGTYKVKVKVRGKKD